MKAFIEVALQTILSFFSILFITRLLGRQQVAQLTLHEYINGITFGSIAATLATDTNQRTWSHFLGLILFGVLTYIMSLITLKNRKASKVIQGEPVIVIQDGMVLEKNLARFYYNIDDLNHLLRKKDVFDINDVRYGILETTGEINIVKIAQKENIKAEDLAIQPKQTELLTDIIVTGNIIYENLRKRNLSVKWLVSQMNMMGVKD
ncbi:MAG TPA: DUF421 domain-containing protein, partial [Patescibacteria group bacterium]|nr:DUF421 domain-containing protein [Patescibacteria group bacterium]